MGWKNLLKNSPFTDKDTVRARATNYSFYNIASKAMEETGWEIEGLRHERMDDLRALTFTHHPSNVKILGNIAPNPNLSNENPWDNNRGFKSMPSVENVKEVLAPTLRSLDWLLTVIEQMGNKVEVKETTDRYGKISVFGMSGRTRYTIISTSTNSGCYEVYTEEGYDICIVNESKKPMGDVMVSLILALANDEQTAQEIEGIEEYLYGGVDVDCQICGNSMYVSWGEKEVQCEECGLIYNVASVRFQPSADVELEQEHVISPKGDRYNAYQIEYMHDGWWKTDDYLFNAINHETVFADSTGQAIVEHHSGIWFGSGDTLLYDEDGDMMPLDEIWEKINNEGDFLDLVYRESNVEPDESEVAELLGYEATTDANYTKDGKYFTFDESDYFQEVEKPEEDLDKMYMSLKSGWQDILKKNIANVNLMLKDYFAAVSHGKDFEAVPAETRYSRSGGLSLRFTNKKGQMVTGSIDVSNVVGLHEITFDFPDGSRQQHISDGLTYDKSNHETSSRLNQGAYVQLISLLAPLFRSLEFLETYINSSEKIIWDENTIRVTGTSGKSYRINTSFQNSDGCYPVTTSEGYGICIVANSGLPLGDNLMSLVGALANDTSKGSQDIDGIREYVFGEIEDSCAMCDNIISINLEKIELDDDIACNNCGILWTLDDVSFAPAAMVELSISTRWADKLPTNNLLTYESLSMWDIHSAIFLPNDDPRITQFGNDPIFCFWQSRKGVVDYDDMFDDSGHGVDGWPILIFSLKENKVFYDGVYIPNREDGPERYEEDIAILLANGEVNDLDGRYMKSAKSLSSSAGLGYNMKWVDYLKKSSSEDVIDWETALKSFISEGKKLGIPLSVMDILKLAKEVTTSQSEGFETLHKPTFGEEEEDDD